MPVTWDDDAQTDPLTIAVRFDCTCDAHASAWQFVQELALGVAAAPPLLAASSSNAPADPTVATTGLVRTRVLSLPEAFYALTSTASLAAPLALGSHAQVYARFSQLSPQHFQRHYAVHVHFRSRGWCLKSGLNYGGHYVLYRGAASAYHSEYIVYVRSGAADEALSWGVVQALTRVAADVKKTVLLCDVTTTAQSDSDISTDTSVSSRSSAVDGTALLTRGTYSLYGQRVTVATTAIRFWDVSAAAVDAPPPGRTVAESSLRFAFQSQPMVQKKLKRPATTSKRPKTAGRAATY